MHACYLRRVETLRQSLRPGDGLLVTDMNNVRYLTGFSGSAGFVLVTKSDSIFVTDFRYAEHARKEVERPFPLVSAAAAREGAVVPWTVVIEKRGRVAAVRRLYGKTGIKRLCIESSVSYEFFRALSAYRGGTVAPLKVLRAVVEKLRAVKDKEEINSIKEAVRRAEAAFIEVRPYIRAGVKERTIALRLEERLKRKGCRRIPFDIIVASGANSARPHAGVTEKRLEPGDFVVIDWGGEAGGYFSDITRTLLLNGGDIGRKKEIYSLVLKAGRKGIRAVSDGVSSGEIDSSARDIIKKAGYGRYFGHALGHGVGLQVHEPPYIKQNGKERIKEGMVFTIEPGVYMPGLGGVRIEDMVVAGKGGARVLTSLPREPEI